MCEIIVALDANRESIIIAPEAVSAIEFMEAEPEIVASERE